MSDHRPPPAAPTLAEEFAAAQSWWEAAGVDLDYDDSATDWLDAPSPAAAASGDRRQESLAPAAKKLGPAPAPPSVSRVMLGGEAAQWPQDLESFRNWWLAEPSLDGGGSFPRIAPTGPAGAKLMVIVAEPEEQDRDKLLSGPHGKFLGNMLDAMGLAADTVYLASALPRHMPLPDWAELQASGLDKLLHHHIALAAPDRICAFGRNIWPLFGHDLAQASAILPGFNHEGRSVPVLGAEGLSELLRSAPRRKRFWHRWLEWTDG